MPSLAGARRRSLAPGANAQVFLVRAAPVGAVRLEVWHLFDVWSLFAAWGQQGTNRQTGTKE